MELLELAAERLIHVHNGRIIVKLATIVRRREYRHQIAVREKFVALLDDLVRAANQVYLVLLAEFFDDRLAEDVGDTSFVVGPRWYIIGISPEQVAQKSLIWRVLRLLNVVDLGQVVQVGRETAVHAHDSLIDDCRDGKIVEHGAEVAPQAY